MLFSIVIPAFNSEEYLNECLRSVAALSFQDFETIIVNDGSTDSTKSIAENFASSFPRVKIINKNNEGLLLARRDGIKSSVGDYIVFLDSDDEIRSDALNACCEIVEQFNPDIVLFDHSTSSDFKKGGDSLFKFAGYYGTAEIDLLKHEICKGKFHSMWGKAIKRECFTNHVPFEQYSGLMHGEDYLINLYLFDVINTAYIDGEKYYHYRQSSTASTAKYKRTQLDDIIRLIFELDMVKDRWGDDFGDDVCTGEMLQICYLLNIFFNDKSKSKKEKKEEFSHIISELNNDKTIKLKLKVARLRVDQKILLYASLNGYFSLAQCSFCCSNSIRMILKNFIR